MPSVTWPKIYWIWIYIDGPPNDTPFWWEDLWEESAFISIYEDEYEEVFTDFEIQVLAT